MGEFHPEPPTWSHIFEFVVEWAFATTPYKSFKDFVTTIHYYHCSDPHFPGREHPNYRGARRHYRERLLQQYNEVNDITTLDFMKKHMSHLLWYDLQQLVVMDVMHIEDFVDSIYFSNIHV